MCTTSGGLSWWNSTGQQVFHGKHAAALSTSIRFFDHTAHNYIHAISDDWKMRYWVATPRRCTTSEEIGTSAAAAVRGGFPGGDRRRDHPTAVPCTD